MRIVKRRLSIILIGAVIITVLSLNLSCPAFAGEASESFVIGYLRYASAHMVLKDKGWLEEQLDLPVKWIGYDSGMQIIEALAESKVDVGIVGSSPAAVGISRGLPLEVIWIHDIIGDADALVVKKQSGINNVEDLKGKRVAAPFGSTTHYHLSAALMFAHIKPTDLTLVYLEPKDMLEAWEKNRIDAGFIWDPTQAKMVQDEGKIIVTAREYSKRGFPTGDLGVVRKEVGQQHPKVVTTYVKNLDRAVKFCLNHPKQAATAVANQLGLSEEEGARQLKGVTLLTSEEQLVGRYFGGTHWWFGLNTLLNDTAEFLFEHKVIDSLPQREVFMKAINAGFLVSAMEE